MNANIKVLFAAIIGGGAVLCLPFPANAQNFSLKPHADIGVGSAMNIKSDFKDLSKSSSSSDFGIDLGYTFWRSGENRLEANIGLGYSTTSLKFNVPAMDYSYNAPASADVDGNAYIRYYELSEMSQKLNLGYFTIPLYLTYGYNFSKSVGLHVDLGFKFGFKCNASLNNVSGSAYSYGVYPEYDDLVMGDPWIDEYGNSNLAEAVKGKVDASGFYASLLLGAAFDVNVYGPLWFNVGLRYNCGFTNSFRHLYAPSNFNATSAPVTYTVANGEEVKPMTGYLTSSRLSPLAIHVGFTINL